MNYTQTLAEIQQEKEALEVELMQAASKILNEWQDKTGLNVGGVYITTERLQAIGANTKIIITDCNVDIEYGWY